MRVFGRDDILQYSKLVNKLRLTRRQVQRRMCSVYRVPVEIFTKLVKVAADMLIWYNYKYNYVS